jgi:drug/metabolite transporter (DMT)-like permease
VELRVALLVLVAATLHASWNALVKASADRVLTMAVLALAGALVGAAAAPFVEPPPAAAIPYLAASVAVHMAYYACLPLAYRFGDLSVVYPVARGTGPLVVALVSAPLAGEVLGGTELAGVALICGGILGLAAIGGAPRGDARRALALALATGLLIGAYTIADGRGVRAAGDAALGYIAWLHIACAVPVVLVVGVARRAQLARFARERAVVTLAGGVVATLAYGIVLWAMTRSRIASVAALRETSVVIAAWIGARHLGEPFGRRRGAAAAIVAAGAIALQLGRGM